MEKEEFVETFKNLKLNVPANIQDIWWKKWKDHRFMFCRGNTDSLLNLFINEAKKMYSSASQ